jgi:hypothetical protein
MGEKDKKKIEKERGKGDLISPQWHLFLFSPLYSQNLSDSSSALLLIMASQGLHDIYAQCCHHLRI